MCRSMIAARVLFSLLFAAMLVGGSQSAHAIWVAVPLEILVDEATIIVEGKVARIEAAGVGPGGREEEAAVIEVNAILKALPLAGQPKQIRIAQPAMGGLAVSTDLRQAVGQQSIWLLTKEPGSELYRVTHPSQVQPADSKAKLTALIAAREKLPGGEAVKGLVARAELIESKPANSPVFFEVRFSLKNVSDKPITISDFVGHRPLVVEWTGPAGKLESTHYDWLKAVRLRAPTAENFPTIPPGGVRFIGPRSKEYGLSFRAGGGPPRADVNDAPAGEHKVVVSYENKDAGETLMLKGVWTGKATANPVTFAVE